MRLRLLVVVIALTAVVAPTIDARADGGFSVEKVDSTGTALGTGVLCIAPSGDLIVTDAPYYAYEATFMVGYPENDQVRVLVRHDGTWSLRAPRPPQDSTMSHDMACGPDGLLRFLTYQSGGMDECRPILEEETPSGWNTTVLDTGRVEAQALALDPQGSPWVVMLREMRSGGSVTRATFVLHRENSVWMRDSVDVGFDVSPYGGLRIPFAVDPSGRPQLLLQAPGSIGLLRAVRDGGEWQVDTIDVQASPSSVPPAFVITPDGTPHVLYGQGHVLWYAALEPTGWVREALPMPTWGSSCAMAFDHAGRPHVAYSARVPQLPQLWTVVHGYRNAMQWNIVPVYDDSLANYRMQIAVDASDRALIYVHDPAYRYPVLLTSNSVTGVAVASMPARLSLGLASGNPCRSAAATSWSLALPRAAKVTLEVHDVAGRCLGSSDPQRLPAGRVMLPWSPPVPGPGCYFVSAIVEGLRSSSVEWILVR